MSRPLQHTSKQLRWIFAGGLLSYYTDVYTHLMSLLNESSSGSSWSWIGGYTSISIWMATVSMFLYLVLLPRFSERGLDYTHWKESDHLKVLIPILTATIVIGFTIMVLCLTIFSSLGLFKSFMAVIGVYTLSFGTIGLIPNPRKRD